MKIMAIDYGDARTGVAISDRTGSIVGTTTVVHSWNPDKTIAALCSLIQENEVEELVMGFPRNMDGTEGARAQLYRAFSERLSEAASMPVHLWDERRTTIEAHQILSDNHYHGKKRKNTVDAVAASLILEGYLQYKNLHKTVPQE